MTSSLKVLLVDDHKIVRSGFRMLLAKESGILVVGEASTGDEAMQLLKSLSPDVVVMDIHMPSLNGIDATRQALQINPRIKVIGLSAEENEELALQMIRAGAAGYVNKTSAYEELVAAIRAVMAGHVYCNSTVISRMTQQHRDGRDHASAFDLLSPRERQHLQLIAEGKTTKDIAATLDVSQKTVETHRRNLMLKLNMNSIAELTKYAVREGLTTP